MRIPAHSGSVIIIFLSPLNCLVNGRRSDCRRYENDQSDTKYNNRQMIQRPRTPTTCNIKFMIKFAWNPYRFSGHSCSTLKVMSSHRFVCALFRENSHRMGTMDHGIVLSLCATVIHQPAVTSIQFWLFYYFSIGSIDAVSIVLDIRSVYER